MIAQDSYAEQIAKWMRADTLRWKLLGDVRSLDLPDCWIAAGFVRDAVWAKLHCTDAPLSGDVDVIWFDPDHTDNAQDQRSERRLDELASDVAWSVKNQARMHLRNGDRPYSSSADAMRFWPETATAVALRRTADDRCEVLAPLGLEDLFTMRLRPAGRFGTVKQHIFDERVQQKQWLSRFPGLRI